MRFPRRKWYVYEVGEGLELELELEQHEAAALGRLHFTSLVLLSLQS